MFVPPFSARAVSLAAALVMGVAACSPAPAAPAKPTAAPAAPTSAPATKAEPAAKTESAAKPGDAAAKPGANAEWDRVLAAAKNEKLVIASMPGENDQRLMAMFKQAFPDIPVEHTGARPSDFSPKLITEQQNGVFAWDVMESTGTSNMHEVLLGADAFQDFAPFIVRPEILEDSKWGTGAKMFSSPTKQHIFLHEISISNDLYINRERISKDELKTLDDLLDPKWQGKIVVDDCTVAAQGASTLLGIWQARGPEFVRKLLTDQKPVFQETVRVTTEWAATGRYPIGIGVSQPELRRLQNDGVGKSLEVLEYGGGNPAAAGVAVFKNAPHPNAAKVFVNWFLSQEGQTAWTEAWNAPVPRNSRRLDVPVKNQQSYPDYAKLGQLAIWGTESGSGLIKQLTTLCKEVRP